MQYRKFGGEIKINYPYRSVDVKNAIRIFKFELIFAILFFSISYYIYVMRSKNDSIFVETERKVKIQGLLDFFPSFSKLKLLLISIASEEDIVIKISVSLKTEKIFY